MAQITWVLNNYHGGWEWIKEYTDSYVLYDKQDKNVGSNIFDYMDYIVKHYDNLPDVVLFGKSNMLERHLTKEEFDSLYTNIGFTPLLTQKHNTYLPVCWYEDGMYCEENSMWYLQHYGIKNKENVDWLIDFFDMKNKKYLKFSPGGCWIVPKENILKNSKHIYEKLRECVSYTKNPGEAHLIERNLYYLWQLI